MTTDASATSQPIGMRQLLLGAFVVAVALSVVGWLTQPEGPPPPIDGVEVTLTDQSFQSEVLDDPGYVLVDFWFEACPMCHRMAPVVSHLSVNYRDRVKVGKVNIDHHQQAAIRYGLQGFPTLLLFHKGELIARWDGYAGLTTMTQWLDEQLQAGSAEASAGISDPEREDQRVAGLH